MMKKVCKIFLAAAMLLATAIAIHAQVGINSTGNAPNSSAMLDVTASNKGVLIPNVELMGTTDATTISNPAISLLVYNTMTLSDVTPGYYYNSGTPDSPVWTRLLIAIPNLTGMVTSSGNATTVVTNANLTGAVTSSGNATLLGSFTSANLSGALTDKTGSGAAVFATSPTLVTPALGTPSVLDGTNITGTAANLTAGNVTNSAVISKVLTGFTSVAGTVANTDNILQAIQKLNGNIKSLEDNLIASGNYKVLDIEGNQYKAVKIGTQTWMAENLKTTKYNNGTPITNVTGNAAWAALATGAYCDYSNTPSNSVTYGRLYNWYAVNTGKLAPTGWHVATDAEWTTLTDYLGGSESEAGGKLKEAGTSHWIPTNFGGTNSSGFTALPGGYRKYLDGTFGNLGIYGYWWSSTARDATGAWGFQLNNGNFFAYRIYGNLPYGFSVRCVRD